MKPAERYSHLAYSDAVDDASINEVAKRCWAVMGGKAQRAADVVLHVELGVLITSFADFVPTRHPHPSLGDIDPGPGFRHGDAPGYAVVWTEAEYAAIPGLLAELRRREVTR